MVPGSKSNLVATIDGGLNGGEESVLDPITVDIHQVDINLTPEPRPSWDCNSILVNGVMRLKDCDSV